MFANVGANTSVEQVYASLNKKAGLEEYPSYVLSKIDNLANEYSPEDISQILSDQIKINI